MTRVSNRVSLLAVDDRSSPYWLREQLYLQKCRFYREFGYGRPPRPQETGLREDGFLFIANELTVVGGCSFRFGVPKWVWITPQYRRRGVLTAAWPQFVRWYGSFSLGIAQSDAMQAFARRMGHVEDHRPGEIAPPRLNDDY